MLESLSEQIRECYEHAEECARKGAAQTNPRLKQDFWTWSGAGLPWPKTSSSAGGSVISPTKPNGTAQAPPGKTER